MQIRRFAEPDRDALRSIYLETRRDAFGWVDASSMKAEDFDSDTRGEVIWVAASDDRVQGFVSVWEPDNFIHNLFVHPIAVGRGLGTGLLQQALDHLGRPAALKCSVHNHLALRFYASRGWQRAGTGTGPHGEYWLMQYFGRCGRGPEPLEIRSYRDADLAAVAHLFTASVHQVAASHYDAHQRSAWAPEPPGLEEWRQRLAAVRTLVCENHSQLAGFVSFHPGGRIEYLFTSPGQTRRGVATALYRHMEMELAASGVEELSTEASLVARPFFERQGFWVVEEQMVERGGATFQRFAMCKRIEAARPRASSADGSSP